jgi:hypothetical protein
MVLVDLLDINLSEYERSTIENRDLNFLHDCLYLIKLYVAQITPCEVAKWWMCNEFLKIRKEAVASHFPWGVRKNTTDRFEII